MTENEKFNIININNYFSNEYIKNKNKVFDNFNCPLNNDVEYFLKNNAIEFAKKNQSVTYLVFTREEKLLAGYFSLAIKPVSLNALNFSKSFLRVIQRTSKLDSCNQTYNLSAYLIAQLGKNFTYNDITGNELLGLALSKLQNIQKEIGGTVAFVETDNNNKLLDFYQSNNFKPFNTRLTDSTSSKPKELVQLIRKI